MGVLFVITGTFLSKLYVSAKSKQQPKVCNTKIFELEWCCYWHCCKKWLRINFLDMTKSETVNRMKNANLSEKANNYD